MNNDAPLTERESLQLIAEMITEAKGGYYHDSGIGAILWGSVVGVAGFMTFLTQYFAWDIDFDWWLLALFALIPQIFISLRDKKNQVVKTQTGTALDIVWMVFGISIFAIIAYMNIAPYMANQFMQQSGRELLIKDIATGEIAPYAIRVAPSPGSLLLLIYALPTIVTGVVKKFRPMIIGAIITYLFFAVSLFTKTNWDNLMMGIAGIINWLIPGLMLLGKYKIHNKPAHV